MSIERLREKMIAIARANPPSMAVPFGFESRIMAHVNAFRPADSLTLWGNVLWRAAASCVAITVITAALSFILSPPSPNDATMLDLETTVMAPVIHFEENW